MSCGMGLPAGQILTGSCFPQQDAPSTCCFIGSNTYVCGADVPVAM
jgi:hypothetical protein